MKAYGVRANYCGCCFGKYASSCVSKNRKNFWNKARGGKKSVRFQARQEILNYEM